MPQHLDSKDCWCQPKLMRECPVCSGSGVHPADADLAKPPPCPQCGGKKVIPATHEDETTFLAHRN